ncbi:immunoglobulin-like protein involved in spore germination [Melghirimyces profundicolus]|uniref:Immunoglobulin-like protein involved in spore germination n=1 Tax=Melghirimyces profundicolus TaxID=1242148 RepID=A0A2T6C4V8_9BACL|nr:Gmad2 immunoglobulin-like domain-containing protein [Melghirimyces profundicolus]PTX63322.1 immunoglobulin-like protein involved in spore germination [Melghirimyces profundicolus]
MRTWIGRIPVFVFILGWSLMGCGASSEAPENQTEDSVEENNAGKKKETRGQPNEGQKTKNTKKDEGRKIPDQNKAFRNLTVIGKAGRYTVKGEARVFEGNYRYAVSDGHDYLAEGSAQAEGGGPDWAPFTLKLEIPADRLPKNGTLTLELYEISPKDGSRENELVIPLERLQ